MKNFVTSNGKKAIQKHAAPITNKKFKIESNHTETFYEKAIIEVGSKPTAKQCMRALLDYEASDEDLKDKLKMFKAILYSPLRFPEFLEYMLMDLNDTPNTDVVYVCKAEMIIEYAQRMETRDLVQFVNADNWHVISDLKHKDLVVWRAMDNIINRQESTDKI